MTSVNVIMGKDFIKYAKRTDLNSEFVKKLDPEGFNIVSLEMLHNDTDIRCLMLFKLVNQEEPYEGTVTVPFSIFNKIRTVFHLPDNAEEVN